MITKASVVSVHVSDQDKALDFYTNTLGFEKRSDAPMGDGTRWLTVAPEGAETAIFLEPVDPGGWANLIFECDDVRATCEELRGRGVEFSEEPTEQPWGMWAPGSRTPTATSSGSTAAGRRFSFPASLPASGERVEFGGPLLQGGS